MIDTKICCDNCGTQLNIDSSYPHNYGIQIRSLDYGINTSGVEYALYMEPPLKKTLDFCGIGCLQAWITKTYPNLTRE